MTTGIKVFLGFAIIPYPFVVWFTLRGPLDGALGSLDALAVVTVWFNLSIALLLAGIHNGIPWWSCVLAVLLIPFHLLSVFSLMSLLGVQPVRWMTVVPALAPVVTAAYIVWASIPRVRGMLPPNLASALVWGAVLSLSIIPLPRATRLDEDHRQQRMEREAPIKARVAQLEQMPPDAPVRDLIRFIPFSETNAEALVKIRASKHKEVELEELINNGNTLALHWLGSFEVSATPGLCECVRKMLKDHIEAMQPNSGRTLYIGDYLGPIDWAARNKCPIRGELSEYIQILRSRYPDSKEPVFDQLDEIQRRLDTP